MNLLGKVFIKQHRLDVDVDVDVDGADALDLTVSGGGIEYTANAWTFLGELAHCDMGACTLGAAIGHFSELNNTVYTLCGSWDVSPVGTVGMDIIRIEGETFFAAFADYNLDTYQVQADLLSTDGLDLAAVAGGYSFGNGFSAIGSLSYFDLAGLDGTSVTIGGQYEFTEGANVELSVGRISTDFVDIDHVSFGLNYELGGRTSGRRTLGNVISGATGSFANLTNF
jgi:hypothetical protein